MQCLLCGCCCLFLFVCVVVCWWLVDCLRVCLLVGCVFGLLCVCIGLDGCCELCAALFSDCCVRLRFRVYGFLFCGC